jgi:hypothetical protein
VAGEDAGRREEVVHRDGDLITRTEPATTERVRSDGATTVGFTR